MKRLFIVLSVVAALFVAVTVYAAAPQLFNPQPSQAVSPVQSPVQAPVEGNGPGGSIPPEEFYTPTTTRTPPPPPIPTRVPTSTPLPTTTPTRVVFDSVQIQMPEGSPATIVVFSSILAGKYRQPFPIGIGFKASLDEVIGYLCLTSLSLDASGLIDMWDFVSDYSTSAELMIYKKIYGQLAPQCLGVSSDWRDWNDQIETILYPQP